MRVAPKSALAAPSSVPRANHRSAVHNFCTSQKVMTGTSGVPNPGTTHKGGKVNIGPYRL